MGWFKYTPKIKEDIGYNSLFFKLKKIAGIAPIMTDKIYKIPSDPHELISKCPQKRFKPYKSDENDCDDMVRIFRGWMSERGWGNVLAMDCKINVPNMGAHRVIAFLHDGRILFGEPKQGKIVEYNGAIIERLIA